MVTEYLGFMIKHDPPAIPIRAMDWQYWHKDYDGPEDGRCGTAATIEDVKSAIREFWLQQSPLFVQYDAHDGWHIVKDDSHQVHHYAHSHESAEWWIIQQTQPPDSSPLQQPPAAPTAHAE